MAEEKSAKAEKQAASTSAPASTADDPKLFGALCYIPFFAISLIVSLFIILTEKKNDKFMAFHAWQSLLFSLAVFVILVPLYFGTFLVGVVSGGIGMALYCLVIPLGFIAFVAMLFLAYKAYLGEKFKLPVVGDFAEKQANK